MSDEREARTRRRDTGDQLLWITGCAVGTAHSVANSGDQAWLCYALEHARFDALEPGFNADTETQRHR